MSRFVRTTKTASGATAVQIITKDGRDIVACDHIGSAHNETELAFLRGIAQRKLNAGQLELALFEDELSGMHTVGAYSQLLFDVLSDVYHRLGLGILCDEVFMQLVLARIIEPTSKLDTIRVLNNLGLDSPSNSSIHRCLSRIVENSYRNQVSHCLLDSASTHSLTLLLYDVTTLYFEAQKEDEYRIPGLSKERRLDPQITVGLLTGRDGFPLEVQSFEGNRAEVKTIIEVLDSFKRRYGQDKITVTADAAMLSSENINVLEQMGYHYIIGSRIAKTPYEIAEYSAGGTELYDGQIFESHMMINTGTGGPRIKRRVIYQYRTKRAKLDLSNIDKALTKAQKMASGTVPFKRNRFLKVSGSKREVNYDLAQDVKRRAGIKGYVTDLDIDAQEIITAYHQLFQIERSFRMTKSDLRARPIFHRTRDSIEAHLTIVLTALAISHRIQTATTLSIRRFLHMLEPVRTSVISIGGKEYAIPPQITSEVKRILDKLGSRGRGY